MLLVWVLEDRILLVTPPGLAASTVEALDHYLFSEKVALADVTARVGALHARRPRRPGARRAVIGADRRPRRGPRGRHARRHRGAARERRRRDGRGRGVARGAPAAAGDGSRAAARGRRAPDRRRSARIAAHRGRDAALRERHRPGRAPARGAVRAAALPFQGLLSRAGGRGPHPRSRPREPAPPRPRGHGRCGAAARGRGRRRRRGDRRRHERHVVLGLQHPIALALVRREHAEPGTAVGVRVDGRVVPATVSALPFAR